KDFYGDVFRISVVLNNLISNAIKYQDPDNDNPMVKIVANADIEKVILSVEDNGIGILNEHLNTIFNSFLLGRDRTRNRSGIGLYIVKEALSRMNGNISVSSEVGEGSKFLITIPNKYEEIE